VVIFGGKWCLTLVENVADDVASRDGDFLSVWARFNGIFANRSCLVNHLEVRVLGLLGDDVPHAYKRFGTQQRCAALTLLYVWCSCLGKQAKSFLFGGSS
jgi:hypothetical protein